jgi:hypothetical protein
MIEILDHLIAPETRTEAYERIMKSGWLFGLRSKPEDPAFWYLDLQGFKEADAIWHSLKARCEALAGVRLEVARQYATGHTYGLGGRVHADDTRENTFTLLVYPMPEWRAEWEGETLFYTPEGDLRQAVRPVPGRAVFFDSRIPHAGRAPGRDFGGLRVAIAFKLIAASDSSESEALQPELPETSEASHPTSASPLLELTGRKGAESHYRLVVPQSLIEVRVAAKLTSIGQTVRLPGFRPGKISEAELKKRYAARARREVLDQVAAEQVTMLSQRGIMPSSVALESGADEGDARYRIVATVLSDIADFQADQVEIIKPKLDTGDPQVLASAERYMRRQVLDALAAHFQFAVHPALIEREFQSLWQTMSSQVPEADREEVVTELRQVAERRVRLGFVVAELARRRGLALTAPSSVLPGEAPAQASQRELEARLLGGLLGEVNLAERLMTAEELVRLEEE